MTDGDRLYEQTKGLAERALQQAKSAYDDSLGILTESKSISVPTVDTTSLTEEAEEIKTEVKLVLLLLKTKYIINNNLYHMIKDK